MLHTSCTAVYDVWSICQQNSGVHHLLKDCTTVSVWKIMKDSAQLLVYYHRKLIVSFFYLWCSCLINWWRVWANLLSNFSETPHLSVAMYQESLACWWTYTNNDWGVHEWVMSDTHFTHIVFFLSSKQEIIKPTDVTSVRVRVCWPSLSYVVVRW